MFDGLIKKGRGVGMGSPPLLALQLILLVFCLWPLPSSLHAHVRHDDVIVVDPEDLPRGRDPVAWQLICAGAPYHSPPIDPVVRQAMEAEDSWSSVR